MNMLDFLRRAPLALALGLVALLGFSTTAVAAQAAAGEEASLLELARPVYEAFASGRIDLGLMLAVVLVVALLTRYAPWDWIRSDAGGAALVLVGSSATAIAAGIATPEATITAALVWAGVKFGVVAAGGYAVVKKLVIDPVLRPLAARAPAWLQPVFALVFWIFDRARPGDAAAAAKARAEADAAGKAALEASPPSGASDITGAPTDIK